MKKETSGHAHRRHPHMHAPYALIVAVIFLIYSPFIFGIPGFHATPDKIWYNMHNAFLVFSVFAGVMGWLIYMVTQLESRTKYPLLAALGVLGVLTQLLLLFLLTPAYDYFMLTLIAPKFCSPETIALYGSITQHMQFCKELNSLIVL